MDFRGLFVDAGGRGRLGWRLAGWLAVLVTTAAALVLAGVGGGQAAQAGVTLAAALVAGWALLALDGRGPGALGFHLAPSVPGEVVRGFVLGTVVSGLAVVVIAAAGGLRWGAEEGGVAAWLSGALMSAGFLALAAAAEEAVFRGYPLQALAEAWGAGVALVVTSVGFGLVHLWNPNVGWIGTLNVMGAGLFLGAVYLRTASLWWATAAHLGWNWTHGWLADLPVSGLDLMDAPWLVARPVGPAWLSGGAFGPEASLVTTAVVVVAAAWTWRTGLLGPEAAAVEKDPLFAPPERGDGSSKTMTNE